MRVRIDEPRRDDHPARVEDAPRGELEAGPDRHDPIAPHCHVAPERRDVARVHRPAPDQQVHHRRGRGAEQQEGQ